MKLRLPAIVLLLICISFSVAINGTTMSRNALFLAFIISLVDFYNIRLSAQKDHFYYFMLVMSLLAGVMIIHGMIFSSVSLAGTDEAYRFIAVKILMSGFILYYLSQQGDRLSDTEISLAKCLVIVGFLYLSGQAIYLSSLNPGERLSIITIPTTVAYVYSFQAFASIYIIASWKHKLKFVLLPLAVCLSFYVIFLTGTRSAILSFPFIIIFYIVRKKFLSKKTLIGYSLIVLAVAVMINHKSFLNSLDRVISTATEISDYKNNDGNTSLGARFSLWKAGVVAFRYHHLGQSSDQRYGEAKNYIDENEHQNPEALRVLGDHFHNDLIEATSLRGIEGMLVLILFYLSLGCMLARFSENKDGAILLLLPLIVYGLTDVFFIDFRNVTSLMMALPIYLIFNRAYQCK